VGIGRVDQTNHLASTWNRFLEKARSEGVPRALLRALLHYLRRVGFEVRPFYYMREVLPDEIPEHLTRLPEGFEFSVFGRDDVLAVSRLEERLWYVGERYVIDNLTYGDACLGIKYRGEIAAFTWYSLVSSRDEWYPVTMKRNEAYLYDMYVLKAYRGNNIAPILRYRNYQVLEGMGRDTFFSLTEYLNVPSFRFKRKLGAQAVFLGVYVGLFKRRRARFVLRRF
jgi:GNAT superfamily N-acetyltransferase